MEDNIIEIKGLSKIYNIYDKPIDRLKEALDKNAKVYHKEFYALKEINLTVKSGEILGLVGRNGAGKSTLLKLITGIIEPSKGSVQTNGTISALLELGTGFNPEYTGIQNIYLYGTMLGKTKEEMDAELNNIISFANIGEFIHQPVKSYSSGMFARLAFSVAVNVKPDILIVDEILAVGDLDFQLKCMDRMKEMMRGGTTVLFVSHDINAVKRFCTRAVWIKSGILIEDGDINIVTDHYLDYLKLENKNKKLADEIFSPENMEAFDNSVVEQELLSQNFTEEQVDDSVSNTDCLKAEIKRFKIYNKRGEEMINFDKDEKVFLSLEYVVHDINIVNPVVGICIRRIDDEYICGFNTLLDKHTIPWKKGSNRVVLEYTFGCLLMGGKYYFDAALFDETATVPIEYRSKIKEFEVQNEYIAEGIFAMPHAWKSEV